MSFMDAANWLNILTKQTPLYEPPSKDLVTPNSNLPLFKIYTQNNLTAEVISTRGQRGRFDLYHKFLKTTGCESIVDPLSFQCYLPSSPNLIPTHVQLPACVLHFVRCA